MNKVREGYKITELGETPSDWNIMKLSEIAEIVMGQSPDSSSYNYIEDGVAFFQGKTEFGRINPVVKKWCNNPTKISKPLDILISVRAPVGDVNINNIEACIGRGLAAIRATSNSNYKYLYYAIQKYNNQLKNKSQGSTFEAINSNDLKGLKLPIPHIDEQEKIALILSTVDEEIDNVDALIEKNKELKKGLMQTLLTKGIGHTKIKKTEIGEIPEEWEVVSLSEITDVRDGTHDSPKYLDLGIPFITSKNLKENKIDFSEVNFISEEDHIKFSQRSNVENGDILFGMIGTIGSPVIVKKEFEFSIKNVALIKFNKSSINNKYILNLLKSSMIENQFLKLSNGGVQKFISLSTIRELQIPVPEVEEQEKIASVLSVVDKKIEEYENKKQKLEELKKGLMQQLLTGNIRVI